MQRLLASARALASDVSSASIAEPLHEAEIMRQLGTVLSTPFPSPNRFRLPPQDFCCYPLLSVEPLPLSQTFDFFHFGYSNSFSSDFILKIVFLSIYSVTSPLRRHIRTGSGIGNSEICPDRNVRAALGNTQEPPGEIQSAHSAIISRKECRQAALPNIFNLSSRALVPSQPQLGL